MAYSTQADVQSKVGGADALLQLMDWTGTATLDASDLADAIAEADAMIDSYAAKVYHVPFSPVPPRIKDVSAMLAILIVRRRRSMQMMSSADEKRWEELTGPQGWLVQLAQGIATPGGDPLPLKHGTMAPDSATDQPPADREISRHKLSGFW